MAAAYRSHTQGFDSNANAILPAPAGLTTGDLLVLFYGNSLTSGGNNGGITPPPYPWIVVPGTGGLGLVSGTFPGNSGLWYRFIGTPAATYTIPLGASGVGIGYQLVAYSGVDADRPFRGGQDTGQIGPSTSQTIDFGIEDPAALLAFFGLLGSNQAQTLDAALTSRASQFGNVGQISGSGLLPYSGRVGDYRPGSAGSKSLTTSWTSMNNVSGQRIIQMRDAVVGATVDPWFEGVPAEEDAAIPDTRSDIGAGVLGAFERTMLGDGRTRMQAQNDHTVESGGTVIRTGGGGISIA